MFASYPGDVSRAARPPLSALGAWAAGGQGPREWGRRGLNRVTPGPPCGPCRGFKSSGHRKRTKAIQLAEHSRHSLSMAAFYERAEHSRQWRFS